MVCSSIDFAYIVDFPIHYSSAYNCRLVLPCIVYKLAALLLTFTVSNTNNLSNMIVTLYTIVFYKLIIPNNDSIS